MKIFSVLFLAGLLIGCTAKTPVPAPREVLPTLPGKVSPVKVKWKVIADVREIEGKKYVVLPYDGNPYIGLSYSDSLVLRAWLNDVKRKNDQTDNVLCDLGYAEKCKVSK